MGKQSLVAFMVSWLLIAKLAASIPVDIDRRNGLPSLAPMLKTTTPSIVNIGTYTEVEVRNPLMEDPFFRRFFNIPSQRRYRKTQSAGSGVIVDSEHGHIVTNHHVIKNADEIEITLADGRVLEAKLVGSDPQVDLSVLQVESKSLSEINFADSNELAVGDFVIAIGSPFGLSQTVTSGIVSALGRSGLGIEGYEDFIQTDASINPGNSGGALVDLNGNLIGINTAIVAPNGGNVGIGFAIPSNMVRAIMEQLIKGGEVRRGYLGLAVQGLNHDLAEAFAVNLTRGVVVVEVESDGPAAKSGLLVGDIILRIGERPISRIAEFHSQTATMFVGDDVELEILRAGSTKSLTLLVEESSFKNVLGRNVSELLLGTRLGNFTNNNQNSLASGVLVISIDSGSGAFQFGLRAGDIVVGANGREVRNIRQLQTAALKNRSQLSLDVYRSGRYGKIKIVSRR